MERILVIGGDSLIARALVARTKCYATSRAAVTLDAFPFDLRSDRMNLASLPVVPVVIICAAINGEAACSREPKLAEEVNAIGPGRITRHFRQFGSDVIFLSSDIADQSAGVYAATKRAGETNVLEAGGRVIRLGKVWDPAQPGILSEWFASLSAGADISVLSDLFVAPIGLDVAVTGILQAIDRDEELSVLTSRSTISYGQIAEYIVKRAGASPDQISMKTIDCGPSPHLAPSAWFAAPDPLECLESVVNALIAASN